MNINEVLAAPNPVVAYCTMCSDGRIMMAMGTMDCKISCDTCHIMRSQYFIEHLNAVEFSNKLNILNDLSCILFFNNYTDNEDTIMETYMSAAYNADINVCLYSYKKDVPKKLEKYLTSMKYGARDV